MKQFWKFFNALMMACLRAADILSPPRVAFAATAATADRATTFKTQGLLSYPVAANTTIYKGTMVCLNSSGYAVPAADTSGYSSVVGVAYEQVVGTSSNGGKNIRVQHNIVALFTATSITQAMVGSKMYAAADNEFDDASSNNIFVGTLQNYVSTTQGWVLIAGVSNPVAPTGTVSGTLTVTSASASSLAVGRQGATNPALVVDASTASSLTGLQVKAAGTGAGVAVSVVETGGTNNSLTIDAMGTGVVNIGGTSTGIVVAGRGANKQIVQSYLKTTVSAQNAAPTAAQMLGGYISHASATGAGTMTTPTGANLSAAIPGVAVGDTFETLYANTGNQTVTITAGDANVTIVVTTLVAIPTHRTATLKFVNTGTSTWDCYINAGAAT